MSNPPEPSAGAAATLAGEAAGAPAVATPAGALSDPKPPTDKLGAEATQASAATLGAQASKGLETAAGGKDSAAPGHGTAAASVAQRDGSISPRGDLHSQAIVPLDDDDVDDADSALGDDNASSTASITSSILAYRTIQGRSFHSEQGDAQYWASNDEAQNELMDINHHIQTLGIGNRLFLAPLDEDNLKNVLDIGTGTGLWAIDFADQYPEAEVVGTDISPIQPSWVPPNLQFEIEDCTREWTFRDNSMDYVHIRYLVGSIKDWKALMAEAFRVCKPGGWVESLEPSSILTSDDGTVTKDTSIYKWGEFFVEGGKKLGASFTVYEDETIRKSMEAAGFVDFGQYELKVPVGGWPKDPTLREMGRFVQHNLEADSEGFVLFFAHALGWSKEEIHVFLAHFRKEMRAGKQHAYFKERVVWARKPL